MCFQKGLVSETDIRNEQPVEVVIWYCHVDSSFELKVSSRDQILTLKETLKLLKRETFRTLFTDTKLYPSLARHSLIFVHWSLDEERPNLEKSAGNPRNDARSDWSTKSVMLCSFSIMPKMSEPLADSNKSSSSSKSFVKCSTLENVERNIRNFCGR